MLLKRILNKSVQIKNERNFEYLDITYQVEIVYTNVKYISLKKENQKDLKY